MASPSRSDKRMHILTRGPGICQNYKKKKTLGKEKNSPYLNADIMCHILNRVPATSLWNNCRFLSKQCSNSICNHNFFKAHFLRSKPGLLTIQQSQVQGKKLKVLKFMEFNESEYAIGKVHNLHTFTQGECIKSKCAGLFLIFDLTGNMHLMNPLTKESIQLPRLGKNDASRNILFDRPNFNYKIADISHKYISKESMFSIIKLRGLDGTCKQIKIAENYLLRTPVLISGVLYCTAGDKGLWCFDLSTDTFCVVGWPINVDYYSAHVNILDVGGYVGFSDIDMGIINVWILRENKWVRCIGEVQPLPGEPCRPFFLGCLSDDVFVFSKDGRKLDAYAYNIKTKQWTMIKSAGNNFCHLGTHVNNILPLSSKVIS